MKKPVCTLCGYIAFNESIPDACPVCHAPNTDFAEQEEAIKTPADTNNLTDLEKKHIPLITIVKECGLIPENCIDAHFKCGEIQHPMLPEHSIVHANIYLNKEFISRIILTPEACNPAGALHLKTCEGTLTALAYCNVHGVWMNEVSI